MLSKLILGTAQIGMDYGINNRKGKVHKNEAFDIFNFAFQNGIQYLDTAPVYGDAQQIIGEFHKLHPSIKFKIITKIPAGYSIEELEQLIDSFLLEMNVDNIDILHFHSATDYINADIKKMSELFIHLKKSRKVLSFGVSIYENSDVNNINRSLIDVIQLPFNLLDNINLRGDLIERLKQQHFTIHTRSTFLQGLFFKETENINSIEIKKSLTYLIEISNKANCQIEDLALTYCFYQKNIDNILIGVDSIEQLKKNVDIVRGKIDTSFFKFINEIRISDNSQLNPSKWQKK